MAPEILKLPTVSLSRRAKFRTRRSRYFRSSKDLEIAGRSPVMARKDAKMTDAPLSWLQISCRCRPFPFHDAQSHKRAGRPTFIAPELLKVPVSPLSRRVKSWTCRLRHFHGAWVPENAGRSHLTARKVMKVPHAPRSGGDENQSGWHSVFLNFFFPTKNRPSLKNIFSSERSRSTRWAANDFSLKYHDDMEEFVNRVFILW